jgi:hypothetical protein
MFRVRTAAILAICLSAGAAQAQGTHQRVRRPPPLEAQPQCELYRGTGSGNSDALIELRLCPRGDGVTGTHQWSSTTSGWSQRVVEGRWEGDHLIARETSFIENRAQPNWRFCLIDRYDLTRTGDRLAGPYVSEQCNDHGSFDLRRVEGAEAIAPQPVREPPAPPPPPEVRERSMIGCAASPSSRGAFAPIIAFIATLVARRR